MLDTEPGSAAESLYPTLGYQKVCIALMTYAQFKAIFSWALYPSTAYRQRTVH